MLQPFHKFIDWYYEGVYDISGEKPMVIFAFFAEYTALDTPQPRWLFLWALAFRYIGASELCRPASIALLVISELEFHIFLSFRYGRSLFIVSFRRKVYLALDILSEHFVSRPSNKFARFSLIWLSPPFGHAPRTKRYKTLYFEMNESLIHYASSLLLPK